MNCRSVNGVSCKLVTFSQVQSEMNVARVHLSVKVDKPVKFVLFLHILGIKYST